MPHNANKALDFGRKCAVDPPVGLDAQAASDAVSACTLSEADVSATTCDPRRLAATPPMAVWHKPASMARSRC